MKFLLFVTTCVAILSCGVKSSKTNTAYPATTKDSLLEENYRLLKEYAICRCLYAVPENKAVENLDVSPAVYSNLLNYSGTDTLFALAKKEGEKIAAEKYVDYQNKKASFFRCSQWANSPAIDSLVRKFAVLAAKAGN